RDPAYQELARSFLDENVLEVAQMRSRQGEATIYHNRHPHKAKQSLVRIACEYNLLNLLEDINTFVSSFKETRPQHMLFTDTIVDVWQNCRIHLPSVQDEEVEAAVRTVQALPPGKELPEGRGSCVLVIESEEVQSAGLTGILHRPNQRFSSSSDNMARQAKSKARLTRAQREEMEEKVKQAKLLLLKRRNKLAEGSTSIRKVAEEMDVPWTTLRDAMRPGHRTIGEVSRGRTLLSQDQEKWLVQYILDMADRNLSLDNDGLKSLANRLIRAKRPGFKGVGKCWVNNFKDRHANEISSHWSRPMDDIRSRSANPEVVKGFFEVRRRLMEQYGISAERDFAADESGVQQALQTRQRLITRKGAKVVRRNRPADRANTTFLPIICADGTVPKYMVIFAAKNKRIEWINDIPPEAEVTISDNGWMTRDLGLQFIQIFDKSTEDLAQGGGYRMLTMDNHGSHMSLEKAWTAAVHAYSMRTGLALTKSSFILVLDTAMKKSFTKENIQMAFKKTGLRPFNPDIITPQMLAPSQVTSIQHTFPFSQPTPVRKIAQEFRNQREQATATIAMPPPPNLITPLPAMALPMPSLTTPVRHALHDVSNGEYNMQLNSSPAAHFAQQGAEVTTEPYHPRNFNNILSSVLPPSVDEWDIMRGYIKELQSKHDVLLAVTVVQDVHYGQMKSQLYHKNQQQRKKSNKEKLYYTEEGREYTGDVFYQAALDDEAN
ncbi:6194_t:CDS:2, partial [Acaulospora colombiana]